MRVYAAIRFFHSIPMREGIIDHVIVGKKGMYAMQIVRPPSGKFTSVVLEDETLVFLAPRCRERHKTHQEIFQAHKYSEQTPDRRNRNLNQDYSNHRRAELQCGINLFEELHAGKPGKTALCSSVGMIQARTSWAMIFRKSPTGLSRVARPDPSESGKHVPTLATLNTPERSTRSNEIRESGRQPQIDEYIDRFVIGI